MITIPGTEQELDKIKMLPRLLLVLFLNSFRCLAVAKGYTGNIHRVVSARNTFHDSNDDSWANGLGARYSRHVVVSLMAVLALEQLVEHRSLLSSAIPSVVFLTCLDWVEVFPFMRRGRRTSVEVSNLRYRWIARILKHTALDYGLIAISDTAEWELVKNRAPFIIIGVMGFGLYRDLEEMVYEMTLPLLVAFMSANFETRNAAVAVLLPRFFKVTVIVAIPTLLQMRGFISDKMEWGRSRADDPSSRDRRRGINSLTTPRRKRQTLSLMTSSNPTGAVTMFGTIILGLAFILGIDFAVVENLKSCYSSKGSAIVDGGEEDRVLGLTDIQLVGIGFLLAAAVLYRWRKWFFSRTENLMSSYYAWEATNEAQRRKSFNLLTLGCCLSVACLWRNFSSLTIFLCLLLTGWMYRKHDARSLRALTLLLRIGVLPRRHDFGLDVPTVLLGVMRFLEAFDYRPFSVIVVESFVASGLALLRIRVADRSLLGVVLLSITASLFMAFANQVSRYQAYKLMRLSRDSRGHLDHAVKQKLAGVSLAIEQVLQRIFLEQEGDPGLIELLREAYVLARRNHDACHLVNLEAATRERGAHRDPLARGITSRNAEAIVRDWEGRMGYLGIRLDVSQFDARDESSRGGELALSLNWDLAYYLVFALLKDYTSFVARKRGGEKVELMMRVRRGACERSEERITEEFPASLMLVLETGISWRRGELRRREVAWLAHALGTELVNSETLRIPGMRGNLLHHHNDVGADVLASGGEGSSGASLHATESSETRMDVASSPNSSFATSSPKPSPHVSVPPGRVFGILDDVALVRMTTLSYLKKEFGASERSFACGASLDDVNERFFELIEERRPDALIIDYYMDVFDGERETQVLGKDVASRCRTRGYDGAILLHSANESIRDELILGGTIDDFLSKSFNRANYEGVIGRAMRSREVRRVHRSEWKS